MLCNLCILLLPMFLSWSVSCSNTLLGLVVILELERDGMQSGIEKKQTVIFPFYPWQQ
jgi:hypothetical protein